MVVDPNHITDDEYQRLIVLDHADDTGDPWRRLGPYGQEGEPFYPKPTQIEKPIRRRLIDTGPAYVEPRPRCCLTCHHPLPCSCDI